MEEVANVSVAIDESMPVLLPRVISVEELIEALKRVVASQPKKLWCSVEVRRDEAFDNNVTGIRLVPLIEGLGFEVAVPLGRYGRSLTSVHIQLDDSETSHQHTSECPTPSSALNITPEDARSTLLNALLGELRHLG